MKRTVLIVAVAALCVAGSAVAQDRSGGLIGSGTRAGDGGQIMGSGNAAGQVMGSGGFTMSAQDQWFGNGGRAEEGGQVAGSGNAAGQMVGSGGFTTSTQGQYLGSGGRAADNSQIFGSGGLIGSGTRAEESQNGGYLGSGLSIVELRLWDGSSLLVVSSDEGMFVIPIEE